MEQAGGGSQSALPQVISRKESKAETYGVIDQLCSVQLSALGIWLVWMRN